MQTDETRLQRSASIVSAWSGFSPGGVLSASRHS